MLASAADTSGVGLPGVGLSGARLSSGVCRLSGSGRSRWNHSRESKLSSKKGKKG